MLAEPAIWVVAADAAATIMVVNGKLRREVGSLRCGPRRHDGIFKGNLAVEQLVYSPLDCGKSELAAHAFDLPLVFLRQLEPSGKTISPWFIFLAEQGRHFIGDGPNLRTIGDAYNAEFILP